MGIGETHAFGLHPVLADSVKGSGCRHNPPTHSVCAEFCVRMRAICPFRGCGRPVSADCCSPWKSSVTPRFTPVTCRLRFRKYDGVRRTAQSGPSARREVPHPPRAVGLPIHPIPYAMYPIPHTLRPIPGAASLRCTPRRRGIVLTNAHLLGPEEREAGWPAGRVPLLRVRVEGRAGGHTWYDATVLHVFSGARNNGPEPCTRALILHPKPRAGLRPEPGNCP